MSEQDEAYYQGYHEGKEHEREYWLEVVERLKLQIKELRMRYDYILKLKSDELLLQLPQPVIWLDKRKTKD